MKFFTYILFSKIKNKFYIGWTENPEERLRKYNSNHKGFTGQASDWEIVYLQEFSHKEEAMKRESEIIPNTIIKYLIIKKYYTDTI
ncbi:MAG: GIY-YIG nuclease family protein [Flavobacteriia bacterium]|nr:GIY-YIG nuclease family protein [Flavobacteriia bacterium]